MRSLFVAIAALAVACGIDAVGTLVPDGDAAPRGGDGARPDAAEDAFDASDEAARVAPLCSADAPGLVVCFPFEGSLSDQSAARIVPLSAANVTFAPGHEDQGVVFTLSPKSDVRLPYAGMNVPETTIELWFAPQSLPAVGGRSVIVDQNGRFGVVLYPDGALRCRAGGVEPSTTTKALPGAWHHIACVHDGTEMRVYLDGAMEASSAAGPIGETADFVAIGQDSPSAGDSFDGTMDSLRIWTRPLPQSEISEAARR